MPARSFTGTEAGRIDGKGRMSIPARFREVLQGGDPDWAPGRPCGMQLIYGEHLKGFLEVRTLANHEEIAARFAAWEPVTDEEAAAKEAAEYFQLTQSQHIEIGEDGRIVLPARFRERIGLTGEATFAGKSDRFEIWAAETFDRDVTAARREFLARQPAGYSPLAALARSRKGEA